MSDIIQVRNGTQVFNVLVRGLDIFFHTTQKRSSEAVCEALVLGAFLAIKNYRNKVFYDPNNDFETALSSLVRQSVIEMDIMDSIPVNFGHYVSNRFETYRASFPQMVEGFRAAPNLNIQDKLLMTKGFSEIGFNLYIMPLVYEGGGVEESILVLGVDESVEVLKQAYTNTVDFMRFLNLSVDQIIAGIYKPV